MYKRQGQDYINHNKRYVWKIPERLEGQIEKGDIVWVHAKKDNKDIKARVLVVDVLEKDVYKRQSLSHRGEIYTLLSIDGRKFVV